MVDILEEQILRGFYSLGYTWAHRRMHLTENKNGGIHCCGMAGGGSVVTARTGGWRNWQIASREATAQYPVATCLMLV